MDKFEVRDERVETLLKEIGSILKQVCPPGYGFSLLIFQFDGVGMFYASNAERESIIKAMQEFIQKFREQ